MTGNTIIYNGIDVFTEAVTMLSYIANDESPMETKKSLIHKYGVSPELLEEPFGVCAKLVSEGKKRLKAKMGKVKEYFTVYGDDDCGSLCKASLALLINQSRYEAILEERKQECLSYGEARRCFEFYSQINTGYSMDMEAGALKEEDCSSLKDLLEVLNEADYTAEQKWQMQWVFNHPKEAFEEIEPCLKLAMQVIEENEMLWRPLVEHFYRNWQERLNKMTVHDYIQGQTGFNIEVNPKGTVILPQIVGLNQFAFSVKPENEKGESPYADICRIGVAIDRVGIGYLYIAPPSQRHYTASMLKLLGDESKLEILSLLKEREYYGGELAKIMNLTTATISHHMGILVNNGMVTVNKEMNRIYYGINEEVIQKVLDNTKEMLLKEQR